jgi:hypothetical protein
MFSGMLSFREIKQGNWNLNQIKWRISLKMWGRIWWEWLKMRVEVYDPFELIALRNSQISDLTCATKSDAGWQANDKEFRLIPSFELPLVVEFHRRPNIVSMTTFQAQPLNVERLAVIDERWSLSITNKSRSNRSDSEQIWSYKVSVRVRFEFWLWKWADACQKMRNRNHTFTGKICWNILN